MNSRFIASQFEPFGSDHLVVIALTVCLSVVLSLLVRNPSSPRLKRIVCISIAVLLIATEWFNYGYVLTQDGWAAFVAESLPLHACGVTLYLTAYTLITKRQLTFEIIYFWGFAGTTQAILTPIAQDGFPAWFSFHFFLTHGGTLVGVSVATFGLRMRPRFKGVWITYAFSWGLLLVVGGLNWLLDTNYMFLCTPPTGNTPFYFLPWPWYILFLGLLALVMFLLLWLPFARRKPD